jgi:hypothetical protein
MVGIEVIGVVMPKWPTPMAAGVTVSRGMVASADMAASDMAVVVGMAAVVVAIADRSGGIPISRRPPNEGEFCDRS